MSEKNQTVTGEGNASRVDWQSMTTPQIEYQMDCFDRHDDNIPSELWREYNKRTDKSSGDWRDQGEVRAGA